MADSQCGFGRLSEKEERVEVIHNLSIPMATSSSSSKKDRCMRLKSTALKSWMPLHEQEKIGDMTGRAH
jgi:hypothetical protein